MAFTFSTLASGSSGNCIFIGTDKTKVLIDVGVSGKKVEQGLKTIGVDPKEIDGIFITHEHTDHIRGIGVLARKYNLPIYANLGTWKAIENLERVIGNIKSSLKELIENGKDFILKDLVIRPYSIPHDAKDPVGYAFYCNDKKVSVATDLGHINDDIIENIKDSNLILLEANHDIEMLKFGKYPYSLKRRILGDFGHLCNEVSGDLLSKVYHNKLETVVLGHLSKENNFPELAYETVQGSLKSIGLEVGKHINLDVAPRDEASKVYVV